MPAKRVKSPAKRPKKSAAPKKKPARKIKPLDLSALPPESVAAFEKGTCLSCVLDVFTRHMGLTLQKAQLDIKRHTPGVEELCGPTAARPYFAGQSVQD